MTRYPNSNELRICSTDKSHEIRIRTWSRTGGLYYASRGVNKTTVSMRTWYESGCADLSVLYNLSGLKHGIMRKYDESGKEEYCRHFLYGTEVAEDDYIKHNIVAKLSGVDTD